MINTQHIVHLYALKI